MKKLLMAVAFASLIVSTNVHAITITAIRNNSDRAASLILGTIRHDNGRITFPEESLIFRQVLPSGQVFNVPTQNYFRSQFGGLYINNGSYLKQVTVGDMAGSIEQATQSINIRNVSDNTERALEVAFNPMLGVEGELQIQQNRLLTFISLKEKQVKDGYRLKFLRLQMIQRKKLADDPEATILPPELIDRIVRLEVRKELRGQEIQERWFAEALQQITEEGEAQAAQQQ